MSLKLLSFLSSLVLITLFIGFNLDNRCDVSFIFYTFRDVPIFVSLLFAFLCGSIAVLPFVGHKKKSTGKKTPDQDKPARAKESSPRSRKNSDHTIVNRDGLH